MDMGIQVGGVSKAHRDQQVWEGVVFDDPPGEVSVLLGPSGTGKAVFLQSLIGHLRPERGKIIADGTNIIERSAKEVRDTTHALPPAGEKAIRADLDDVDRTRNGSHDENPTVSITTPHAVAL